LIFKLEACIQGFTFDFFVVEGRFAGQPNLLLKGVTFANEGKAWNFDQRAQVVEVVSHLRLPLIELEGLLIIEFGVLRLS